MEKRASKNLFIALIAGVMLLTLSFGCVKLGKTTPAKPAIASAVENVKDADDHLATAEKHLRADPPAVPEAKTEIGSARDQLTFAQSDLKAATKNTSVNDAKAKKFDEMQDDYIGPAGMWWVWRGGFILGLGVVIRLAAIFVPGGLGAIFSRLGSFLMAIATMGLTAIQWIAEEVWQWLSKKRVINGPNGSSAPASIYPTRVDTDMYTGAVLSPASTEAGK